MFSTLEHTLACVLSHAAGIGGQDRAGPSVIFRRGVRRPMEGGLAMLAVSWVQAPSPVAPLSFPSLGPYSSAPGWESEGGN